MAATLPHCMPAKESAAIIASCATLQNLWYAHQSWVEMSKNWPLLPGSQCCDVACHERWLFLCSDSSFFLGLGWHSSLHHSAPVTYSAASLPFSNEHKILQGKLQDGGLMCVSWLRLARNEVLSGGSIIISIMQHIYCMSNVKQLFLWAFSNGARIVFSSHPLANKSNHKW